ncbi:MAG: M20/M25/M40 family metallo-hydrolase [Pseudomonadota bacterium]
MDTQRMLNTFCELVKIPSESPDDHEFIKHMDELLKKEGAKTQKDAYGNLIAKFEAKNSSNNEPIMFCCHADTVKPGIGIKPIIDHQNGVVKTDGTTILAADDKAGITQVLEMLQSAKKHPPIEFIITRCEEIGLLGSMNLDYSLIRSKFGYVMDTGVGGRMVIGAPTLIELDVDFKGRASHAGMAPEKGISAITTSAQAISKLKFGKLDEETTANIGTIHGGEIRNGVPEHTKLQVECRSLVHEKAVKVADEMERVFKETAKENGAEVFIERKLSVSAYSISTDSRPVKVAKDCYTKNDITPDITKIRGASDAAHFNSHGIATIVLGVGYRDAHSKSESLVIKEMEYTAKVLTDLVESLA